MASPGPYTWEPHAVAWAVVATGVAAVVVAHRRMQRDPERGEPWGRRRVACFAGAAAGLLVALSWPVADLAAHWSLTLLVVQRLLLLLLVAPLLWLGLPGDVLRRLTRPAPVDAVLSRVQRPPVAVVVVTVASIGSMTPVLVRAQAHSVAARGAIDLGILLAGFVLWLPVLGRLPATPRPKPIVRFGYLVFQAVVPAFLSFVYIFSRRPLYETFARSAQALHVRPLTDQQIAGFVSKLSMLVVLLTVGSVVLARASRTEEEALDEPLVWADVERAFERVDRRRQHRRGPGDASAGSGPADRGSGSAPPGPGPGDGEQNGQGPPSRRRDDP